MIKKGSMIIVVLVLNFLSVDATWASSIYYNSNIGLVEVGTENDFQTDDQEDDSKPTLTLEEAIAKAQTNNLSIRKAQLTVKQKEETQDLAEENLDYIPVGTGNGEDDASVRSDYVDSYEANIDLIGAKKQLEIEKDSLEYQVMDAYYAAIQAEIDRNLAEISLEQATSDKELMEKKEKLGLATDLEVTDALNEWKEAQADLEQAEQDVIDSFEDLNRLMGTSLSNQYSLEASLTFENLANDNVDYQVAKILSDSTSIWLAEQDVNLAELHLSLYSFNTGSNSSYTQQELAVDQAELQLESTKEQLETTVRNTYSNIKELENEYATSIDNLDQLQETLEVVELKYEYGLATELELEKAILAVKQAENKVLDALVQLELEKYAYEKPWV